MQRRFLLDFTFRWSKRLILSALGLAFLVGLLTFKLGSLTEGLSPNELSMYRESSSLLEIIYNPIYAPYKIVAFLINLLVNRWWAIRLASVFFASISAICVYYVLTHWLRSRLALLGTFIFTSSAWLLHLARLGDGTILYVTTAAAILAFGVWQHNEKAKGRLSLLNVTLLGSLVLYLPGGIWFLLVGAIWQRKTLVGIISRSTIATIIISSIAAILLVTPLVYAWIHDPVILRDILAVTITGLSPPEVFIWRMLSLPKQIFLEGPSNFEHWLGTVPLLDAATATMAVLGCYLLLMRFRLDRTKFLIGILVVVLALRGFGNMETIHVLLPLIYTIAMLGIDYILDEWFSRFPRNPIARLTGYSLIFLMLLSIGLYNLGHYFIAWPRTPEVKTIFTQKV